MKRTAIVLVAWFGLASSAWSQSPSDSIPSNAGTGKIDEKQVKMPLPPSPGEAQLTPETRQREQYLLQQQAAEESVIRAAKMKADQRNRRLESRRWFGLSNQRPMAGTDPYNGDYAPHWVGNDPTSQYRWVGVGQPWVIVTGE